MRLVVFTIVHLWHTWSFTSLVRALSVKNCFGTIVTGIVPRTLQTIHSKDISKKSFNLGNMIPLSTDIENVWSSIKLIIILWLTYRYTVYLLLPYEMTILLDKLCDNLLKAQAKDYHIFSEERETSWHTLGCCEGSIRKLSIIFVRTKWFEIIMLLTSDWH